MWILSQSYGASPAIWDHTVLPATRHRWMHPTLSPVRSHRPNQAITHPYTVRLTKRFHSPHRTDMQAGIRFTYPGGMEGWVDLGVGYIPRWFTCPHPLVLVTTWEQPDWESNSRPLDPKSNVLTITLTSHLLATLLAQFCYFCYTSTSLTVLHYKHSSQLPLPQS